VAAEDYIFEDPFDERYDAGREYSSRRGAQHRRPQYRAYQPSEQDFDDDEFECNKCGAEVFWGKLDSGAAFPHEYDDCGNPVPHRCPVPKGVFENLDR
jgi:hypothetical protein